MIKDYRSYRRVTEEYDAITLTDKEVQKILSVLLRSCTDKALATVLRKIIFNATYDINWQEAWDIITEYMPELTQYDDFESILYALR